jgi:4-amino-4-deoxy-L-arabinose transferase-like glycosyltransferase
VQISNPRPPVRFQTYVFAFSVITAFLILSHSLLLELPFYWDEVGQFVPAALDIFRAGAWIPVSTAPNVHPPGVMAYLALVWSIFGYSIVATRVAMLLVAAGGALVTFLLAIELGRGAPGTPAFTALALLCLSPLFFAQSMLAQLDMPAMACAILALLLFLQNRWRDSAIVCTVLVLVKETGAVVPALFGCWLLVERRYRSAAWFLLPGPGLAVWLIALHHATGHWFGNAAFAAYNVNDALHPAHVLGALMRRVYYLFLGSGHFIGSAALAWALGRMPLLRDRAWRIAWSFVFAQVCVVSLLGGATLERYLLPVLPVVFIAFAIAMRALHKRMRQIALGGLVACLIAANFVNPPYPFPLENNLAFTDFVRLEESTITQVEHDGLALPGGGLVAASFPVSNALRNPDFGYAGFRHHVLEVTGFTRAEVDRIAAQAPDMVVVPPRPWDPLHLLDHPAVVRFLTSTYAYEPELSADQTAAALSMRITRRFTRRGLSMQLLERAPRN